MKRAFIAGATLTALLVPGVTALADTTPSEATDVLVYSFTETFRHDAIPDGIAAIEELGEANGFGVEASEDPAVFTDDNLARFDAVIFLNTTGNVVEDEGKAAFERYMRGGGGWVGVHSAADTEYEWPFYGELLGGAYFLTHPLVNQPGTLDIEDHDHPSTAHLPERWSLPSEEYYSFTQNPRGNVRILMTIDESSYLQVPNTAQLSPTPWVDGDVSPLETGIMGDHPMAWCSDVDEGRAWYTALGHEADLYARDDFREHLLQGILTAAGVVDADCSVQAAAAPEEPAAPEPDPAAPAEEAEVDDTDLEAAPAAHADTGPILPATGTPWITLPALLLLAFAALGLRTVRGPSAGRR